MNTATEKRMEKSLDREIYIPLTIFRDRKVSVLEALVEYLKEQHKFSYREIAYLINRDERNIWTIYNRANIKRSGEELKAVVPAQISIPLFVVRDRSLSIFEVIVEHLKTRVGLNNHAIAMLTNRSDKTIWTIYNRVKGKRKNRKL